VSDWVYYLLVVTLVSAGVFLVLVTALQYYVRRRYLQNVVRIFEERPFFIIPQGKPIPGAEEVHFETTNGLTLRGCYLYARKPRKGVILFGLEFGSTRWSCYQYCSQLLDAGYDIFAYEPRNQGESDIDPDYAPLQWVTDRDADDMLAAIQYLKRRKDAPEAGIGILGVSKGGSLGILAAASEPWVKCVVTDGAYGTYTTMVPYMRRWAPIYINSPHWMRRFVPDWFYGLVGLAAIKAVAHYRGVSFLSIENALQRLQQPLFMIHGQKDTYIKPEMAESLLDQAATLDKRLWVVANAKHNCALTVQAEEYTRQLTQFFSTHLNAPVPDSAELLTPVPVSVDRLATASGS
jgi:uncharacterized protein